MNASTKIKSLTWKISCQPLLCSLEASLNEEFKISSASSILTIISAEFCVFILINLPHALHTKMLVSACAVIRSADLTFNLFYLCFERLVYALPSDSKVSALRFLIPVSSWIVKIFGLLTKRIGYRHRRSYFTNKFNKFGLSFSS